MLERIARGPQVPEDLARLALGHLKQKTPELILALDGSADAYTRWILGRLLSKLDWLESELASIDARLCEQMLPWADLIHRLCTIPGVDKTTARVLIAELGTDMAVFGDARRAASWAGLCPGNSESGGKRFSGRTRKGDRYLRRMLVQSAWAVARKDNCFLAALFRRVAHKHGMKKAAVAVAHRILVITFCIIRDGSEYYERGGEYFDQLHPERTAKKLVRRLQRIGLEVTVKRPRGRPRKPPELLKPSNPAVAVPHGPCPRCWRLGISGECFHLLKRFKKTESPMPPSINSEG